MKTESKDISYNCKVFSSSVADDNDEPNRTVSPDYNNGQEYNVMAKSIEEFPEESNHVEKFYSPKIEDFRERNFKNCSKQKYIIPGESCKEILDESSNTSRFIKKDCKQYSEQCSVPTGSSKQIPDEDDAISIQKVKTSVLLSNRRALSKAALTYELEKFEKNCLLIFNQECIDGYSPRHGTHQDAAALKYTFKRFNFDVCEYKDYTKKEIFDVLKTFVKQDFSDYGCVAVAILTHGSTNGRLYAQDKTYNEREILEEFSVTKNPSLITKPKIVIIEACRGPLIDTGTMIRQSHGAAMEVANKTTYFLPVETDMLILHSSYAGNVSYRNTTLGSWFIQTLCEKINSHADKLDFETVVTLAKKEVAINKYHEVYNSDTRSIEVSKQMPVVSSTLIRKLYLGGNNEQSNKNERKPVVESSCSCFLSHFKYLKMCLIDYIQENPHDEMAKKFRDIAESLNDSSNFMSTKRTLNKMIAEHLMKNAKKSHFYKYIYLNDLFTD